MLFKTPPRPSAGTRRRWLLARVCDLSGHGTRSAVPGPYGHGYAHCTRCGRVLGPGE